nr:MAG TPA: Protein of unknown function (DUF2701) [Herelleviridae sp.]
MILSSIVIYIILYLLFGVFKIIYQVKKFNRIKITKKSLKQLEKDIQKLKE